MKKLFLLLMFLPTISACNMSDLVRKSIDQLGFNTEYSAEKSEKTVVSPRMFRFSINGTSQVADLVVGAWHVGDQEIASQFNHVFLMTKSMSGRDLLIPLVDVQKIGWVDGERDYRVVTHGGDLFSMKTLKFAGCDDESGRRCAFAHIGDLKIMVSGVDQNFRRYSASEIQRFGLLTAMNDNTSQDHFQNEKVVQNTIDRKANPQKSSGQSFMMDAPAEGKKSGARKF